MAQLQGKESFDFKMTQSLEASEGRIQFRRHAGDHESVAPYAVVRGVLTLRPVCSATEAPGGGIMVEGRISQVAVDCDESRTPNQR
eukprot:g4111.t1